MQMTDADSIKRPISSRDRLDHDILSTRKLTSDYHWYLRVQCIIIAMSLACFTMAWVAILNM